MKDIKLPEPQKTGGMPIMEAFSRRASHRKCADRDLDLQTVSNILWAAFGFNRENFRTAPSSHNRQETELYVFLKSGVYKYEAESCLLRQIIEGDRRALSGMQDFVAEVPLNIALVSDTSKITGKTAQGVIEAIYANAGFICENIYLYAAAAGLNTVARAMIDKEALAKELELSDSQIITLIQSVGFPKD